MFFFSRRAIGEDPWPGQQRHEQCRRIDQLDAVVAEDVGDRADETIGIARANLGEQREQRDVGNDPSGENLRVLHLAGHDGVRRAGLLEELDAGAELAERDPVDLGLRVGCRLVQLRKCFLVRRDDRHVVSLSPRGVEDEEGESAVPGDEA